MINFFKRLSLPAKLILIGLVPSLFLVYLSLQLYLFERQKLDLLHGDVEVVNRSIMVNRLIDQLQEERRSAYKYSLTKNGYSELVRQQANTDAIIKLIEKDPELKGFENYTLLDSIKVVRAKNESGNVNAGAVMNNYTMSIFRISMVEVTPQLQITQVGSLNQDLHGARAMSQIVTYLGIIRSVIYNVLYTRKFQFGNGTLLGSLGAYQIYSTYQTEFRTKSSPWSVAAYQKFMSGPALMPVTDYLAKSYKTMQFDSTSYNDTQWWDITGKAIDNLRDVQSKIWNRVSGQLTSITQSAETGKDRLLLLLFFALAASVGIISISIISITRTLTELRIAAEKIAAGETGLKLNLTSDDVIGRLAKSVSYIDANNKMLCDAANEIRKGNFDASVIPRGASDILSNSLLQMKDELKKFTEEKLERTAELEHLINVIKASENHFKQIADQTPFMIWQTNSSGEAIYVNKQWSDFTGLSQEDSVAYGWRKALHPDDDLTVYFPRNTERHLPVRTKARFKKATNEYRWILIHADPIYNNGGFQGYIGSLTDIHDQLAAEQAALDLMNKKDEFLTIASHELKTPLTSIKAYTQLVKRNISENDKSYPLITKTDFHIERLEKLIKDLLDVSRINSGQMIYEDSEFEFEQLLKQNVEHFMDVSDTHQVTIERTMPALVNGDRTRIEQVLNNLLHNAVKYSPEASYIVLNSYVKDGNVVVSIKDFGIGIDKNDLPKIFDKFYRTQKNFYKFQGLGLGLFICGEIIKRHKGKIWAESGPDIGSIFFFTIPLAAAANQVKAG